MRTDFFYKKCIILIGIFFFFGCVITGFVYRAFPKKCNLGAEFYFLVSQEESVEAGAEFVKLEGGAGYVLKRDGQVYVVLSVYLREQDALAVQEVLSAQSRETRLLSLNVAKLCFRGKKEKEKSGFYIGALQSLYGCLVVLENGVAKLEKGLTQEKAKGLLATVKKQLSFMSEIYAESYSIFSDFCTEFANKLQKESDGILYVSDLRYILCEGVAQYLQFTTEFV